MAPRPDLAKIEKEVFDIIDEHFGHKRVPRADLAKIGREGFDIIDEQPGWNGKKISQPSIVHAAHILPPSELKDCRPAAVYGGVRIADFRPKNSPRKAY